MTWGRTWQHCCPQHTPLSLLANYIAMVVRNAMEDFHTEHLTDEQMTELNPIIRDAICTALHSFLNRE